MSGLLFCCRFPCEPSELWCHWISLWSAQGTTSQRQWALRVCRDWLKQSIESTETFTILLNCIVASLPTIILVWTSTLVDGFNMHNLHNYCFQEGIISQANIASVLHVQHRRPWMLKLCFAYTYCPLFFRYYPVSFPFDWHPSSDHFLVS